MKVLVVEPEKRPYAKEIVGGLQSLQSEVGGMIEAVYPFDDQVAIVCNEEGKINGLPLNRALRTEDGTVYDIVAGTFLVVGLTEEDFGSLSGELVEKYMEVFRDPELFFNVNGKLVVFR